VSGGARWLRRCEAVGEGAALQGRPTIRNHGRITIGARLRMSSSPIPSHIEAAAGASVRIGDDVEIAHGAAISAQDSIVIGDRCMFGPFVHIMDTDFHVPGDPRAVQTAQAVTIGDDVQVGAHVTILRGAQIGDGARIESGAVVAGAIAPAARVGGVPARVRLTLASVGGAAADVETAVSHVVMQALGLKAPPGLTDGPQDIARWDSLGVMKLVLALEEAFATPINAGELARAPTIGAIAALVRRAKVAGAAAPGRRPIAFHSPPERNPDPVYVPDPDNIAASALADFVRFAMGATGRDLTDPLALHAFSVAEFRTFWTLFVRWSGFVVEGPLEPACVGDVCETAVFFPQLRLNYAQNLLRAIPGVGDAAPALSALNEAGGVVRMTRGELRRQVLALAAALKAKGIVAGDRVVAVAGNDAEAIVACLACAAIGAVWSSVAPEIGADTVLGQFGQLAPKAIFHRSTYLDHGKTVDVRSGVEKIVAGLSSLKLAVALGCAEAAPPKLERMEQATLAGLVDAYAADALRLEDLELFPFNHPLFILFSSGTTGPPKCLMHGAGGTLLEHHKEHRLHSDFGPADKVLFLTTCSWMMWNWLVSALAAGSEIVLYEGSVSFPEIDSMWSLVARERLTVFGTSPAFLQFTASAGVSPKEGRDFTTLRSVLSTGSVLPDTAFEWVRDEVGAEIAVQSVSGGTDMIGCFLLGHPALPVYAGELQSITLGLDVRALGATPENPIGELICANPFPSRPLGIFGDASGEKFQAAYFSQNPGVWTHGDRFEWTHRNTGRLHGRSDAVMNIRGIRIGPAVIYSALAEVEEIVESMAVEQRADAEAGGSRLVLIVVLHEGVALDADLAARIRSIIETKCSRAHVPSTIIASAQVPLTHNNKRAERAARDAVNGDPVGNRKALKNPECLDAIRQAVLTNAW
jgi:acetoacetyl-CoA synthetase